MNAGKPFHITAFNRNSQPRPNHTPLQLERLEERIAPAGAIITALAGGSLVITGDDAANDIVLDHDGLGENEVRISSGGDTTLIDGDDSPKVIDGVTGNITILLKGGDDVLNMASVDTAKNLTIDGGDGDNSISLGTDLAWLNVAGNLTVKNGEGLDTLALNISVNGAVSVSTGNGGSVITLQGPAEKAVSVKCGDGADTVLFDNMHSHGTLKFDVGDGGTDLDITSSVIPGGVAFKSGDGFDSVTIDSCDEGDKGLSISTGDGGGNVTVTNSGHGKISIKNGIGDNSLVLDSVSMTSLSFSNLSGVTSVVLDACGVTGNVSIKNGAGNTAFTLESNTGVGGKCSITNGDGDHTATILDSILGSSFSLKNALGMDTIVFDAAQIRGAATIANGDGGSDINIQDSLIGSDGGGGPVYDLKVKNGAGSDYLYGSLSAIGRDLAIDNGDGDSTAWLVEEYIGRDLKVLAKAGDDVVDLDGTDTLRGALLKVGDGANKITIDDGTFTGPVTVLTGVGADLVALDANGIPSGDMTTFGGPVKITVGLGDDVVRIGKDDDAGNACLFFGPLNVAAGAGNDSLYC